MRFESHSSTPGGTCAELSRGSNVHPDHVQSVHTVSHCAVLGATLHECHRALCYKEKAERAQLHLRTITTIHPTQDICKKQFGFNYTNPIAITVVHSKLQHHPTQSQTSAEQSQRTFHTVNHFHFHLHLHMYTGIHTYALGHHTD